MATAIGYPGIPHREATLHHHSRGGLIVGGTIAAVLLLSVIDRAPTAVPTAELESPPAVAAPDLDGAIATLQQRLRSAETVLAASEARVRDDSVRIRLDGLIERGEQSVRDAQLVAAFRAPGSTADAVRARGAAEQQSLSAEVVAATAAVETAVTEWTAEQARIAAEREAARLAAVAAAAAAAHTVGARTGPLRPAGAFVESIWTTGGQAQVDACRGSVNFAGIAGYLGAAFYAAEHWSCGGRAWAGLGTGARVDFPGYGSYQIVGQVGGLALGADASMLPAGYDGYYQSCIDGSATNMHVWLLRRVA